MARLGNSNGVTGQPLRKSLNSDGAKDEQVVLMYSPASSSSNNNINATGDASDMSVSSSPSSNPSNPFASSSDTLSSASQSSYAQHPLAAEPSNPSTRAVTLSQMSYMTSPPSSQTTEWQPVSYAGTLQAQSTSGVSDTPTDISHPTASRGYDQLTVRVLSAETRRDLAGKKYTTYVMRVHHPNNDDPNHQQFPDQIEHRYSDFAKLHQTVEIYRVNIGLAFPSKHWAGRVGNWTPSFKWAPEQHSDLIQSRKVQLDFWLVHLVEKMNRGELPEGVVQAIHDFLTVADKPPCDQDNTAKDQAWKWNNPVSFTLGSSIRQATSMLEHMCLGYANFGTTSTKKTDRSIPLDLLQHAKGLCFLTVVKAGLVVSGRVGTGLLVARLDADRWSAPCALGTMGMGYGMLAGGDITHYLVILTTSDAVQSLVQGTGVQLGAELGVAVGPIGRGATSQVAASNDNTWAVHAAYSYAHSQGLFAGVSLEGSILSARHEVNAKFYGRRITPEEVLDQPAPKAAGPLYDTLRLALAQQIPVDAFRPSVMFSGHDTEFVENETAIDSSLQHQNILNTPTESLV